MQIIPHKKFWLTLSSVAVIASIAVFLMFGLRLSADFTEGTLFALKFKEAPVVEDVMEDEGPAPEAPVFDVSSEQVSTAIESFEAREGQEPLGRVDLKKSTDGTFFIKLRRLSDAENDGLLAHLRSEVGDFDTLQSRNVSPVFAKTFRDRAIIALIVTSLMIILYITFAFRKVSRGIKSWKLGVAAIIALIHDLIIIVGIFSVLGLVLKVEVDALFITALLSVMGFSVNDTIVVFDRVRENILTKHYTDSFEVVAEKSLQQTLARSINTSFSTLLVLGSLLILGVLGLEHLFYFVLALLLGVIIGTYSSIFLATPLLTIFQKSEK